jgi:putative hydrolase of the HAD superfamily
MGAPGLGFETWDSTNLNPTGQQPMLPFNAILFDVGGVLLTNGWDHVERATVLAQFHLDREAFEARHTEPFNAWERDAITMHAYLDATVFYEPRGFSRDEFFAAICAQSKPLPDGALQILQELSGTHPCLLGYLNNEPREPNDYRFRQFGLRELVDVSLSSCYVGLRKPEPAMYRRAIDIIGGPPERILFIDDRAGNVAGAVDAGMKTIQFENADALRSALQRYGVL